VCKAADFTDLGMCDTFDKPLQRTVSVGRLRRTDRGLYDTPEPNSLTRQSSPPDRCELIEAVARRDQMAALVDGMTAASRL
jgi:hypothetical protein